MSSHQTSPSHRWVAGEWISELEPVANETLVSIHVNQEKITSLLASDNHLEALYRGHLATEYDCIVQGQIKDYSVRRTEGSIELHGAISSFKPKVIRKGLVTTSCSACDHDQLPSLLSDIPRVDEPQTKVTMESS